LNTIARRASPNSTRRGLDDGQPLVWWLHRQDVRCDEMDELAVVGANHRVSGVLPSPARLPKGRLVDEGKPLTGGLSILLRTLSPVSLLGYFLAH
jgi:hypothetical protein